MNKLAFLFWRVGVWGHLILANQGGMCGCVCVCVCVCVCEYLNNTLSILVYPSKSSSNALSLTYSHWEQGSKSRNRPNPGVEPTSPALQAHSLPAEPQGKPKNTGVGSLSLLQRIFVIQELNWGLPHCRQILYQLTYQVSSQEMLYWVYVE